jgi:chromosome segregation ATPase
VLTDGDLDGYRKIGNAIGKCENEKQRLVQARELLEKQMESMDREVLSLANRIQEEYEDILSDVLPSDYEYSLKSGEDVKKLRNQLRKMYKRLGLLSN